MSPEQDRALCRCFPLLFAERHNPPEQTCMHFGFSCSDGWFGLIFRLCEKLESLIEKESEEVQKDMVAVQVKEKFGTLRFYMSSETKEMTKAITLAERESAETCEECSDPGLLVGKHWVRTLCEVCSSNLPS